MKLVYVGLKVDIRLFIVLHLIVDNGGLLNKYKEIILSIVMYVFFFFLIYSALYDVSLRVVNIGFVSLVSQCMKVEIVSPINRFWSLIAQHLSSGLQYQEDLKIRAANDETARKDKEHLEVCIKVSESHLIFDFI